MAHILLAPDSFKGTMTALEVCEIWEQAVKARLPHMECRSIPLADGGEGMVDAYLKACGGKRITARVHGPFMEEVEAVYGLLPDGTAVLEMASCGGLPLAAGRLDPLRATTYGVGELLLHSASRGAQRVLLGLGGSATNDGGMGMAAALGYTFVDGAGCLLPPLAQHMGQVAEIQPPPMAYPLPVIAACDVDNPLCGPRGATAVFGGQKGVTPQTAPLLEQGLSNLAERVQKDLGKLVWELPGAGAAGGLGAGAVAFAGATLQSGIQLLLDAAGFDQALGEAALVITGEGRLDGQSLAGKAPLGVARRCKAAQVPCIALCGSLGPGAEDAYSEGITAAFSAVRGPCDFQEIQRTCREDMARLAEAVLGVWELVHRAL